MFDTSVLELRASAVEERLRAALVSYCAGRGIEVADVVHGSPNEGQSAVDASSAEGLEGWGDGAALRRLLDAGAERLAAAQEAGRAATRAAAEQARELAAFALLRPARILDRPAEDIGAAAVATRAARPEVLTDVSEWAVDEVMVALGVPGATAARLLSESVTLAERLPATLAAAEAAEIAWTHVRVLVDVVAPVRDGALRGEVERRLIAYAARGRTAAQLRVAARRAVLCADAAAAAERAVVALRGREVRVYPGDDGMATLHASLPTPVALTCRNALERYAEACRTPGDERTAAQRMVDCLAELILRPGASDLPPVQAELHLVAPVGTLAGGDEPGEVDGHLVPGVMVRELAYSLGLLPRPSDERRAPRQRKARQAGVAVEASGEAVDAADGDFPEGAASVARAAGLDPASDELREDLGRLLSGSPLLHRALVERPTVAIVEELSGQLLALTDAGELGRAATCGRRACRGGTCSHLGELRSLGPPRESPGYRPDRALDRFVRARDRRCRFPGCRARALRCDLDHTVPWPGGATSAANLCCLCRHHHRLSHQAPGWRLRSLADGGLEWTTPGGEHLVTFPLRYGRDADVGDLQGSPAGRTHSEGDDDPPPF